MYFGLLWVMQLACDISEDDEQHLLGITTWRNIGKLYGQLCYTSKNNEEIKGKNNLIFESCRKTQFVFWKIKIQL